MTCKYLSFTPSLSVPPQNRQNKFHVIINQNRPDNFIIPQILYKKLKLNLFFNLLVGNEPGKGHVAANANRKEDGPQRLAEIEYSAFATYLHLLGGDLRDGERDKEGGFALIANFAQTFFLAHGEGRLWDWFHQTMVDRD